MRRMILTSLVLFPVLAHAQASAPAEPKPSPSSAVQLAELTKPAGLFAVAAAESPAAVSLNSNQSALHETVRASFSEDFVEAALRMGGTLEYSMKATPTEVSAPKVTRAVELQLSDKELSEQPAVSNVVVHAIVDEQGIPRNVQVTKSAGSVVDQKAIAAVSQYRFQPATFGNQPTWAAVSIAIKIQK